MSTIDDAGKLEVLRQVGYPITQLGWLEAGVRAYDAAVRVQRALERATGYEERSLDPALIPNQWDVDTLVMDTYRLSNLLELETNLRRVRFAPGRVGKYFVRALKTATSLPEDKAGSDAFGDRLAISYARDEEPELMAQLPDRLLQAVRADLFIENLRSLGLGIVYAERWKIDRDSPNALAQMMFRMSLRDDVCAVGGRASSVKN